MLFRSAGAAPGDPYAAPHHPRPFLDEVRAQPGRLRIAVSTTTPINSPVHEEAIAAVKHAAKLCESLGHIVEEAAPKLNGLEITAAQGIVISANVAFAVEEAAEALGRKPRPEDVERATWFRVENARKTDSSAYARAMNTLHLVGRNVAAFMENYDVILQPSLAQPPLPIGVLDMEREDLQKMFREMISFIPYTGIYNLTGQPSANIPLYWTPQGLPLGTMFTTRFGDEATIFRLAAQLEQAQPWKDRYPPL